MVHKKAPELISQSDKKPAHESVTDFADGSNFLARGYGTSTRPTGMPARPPSAYLMFVKDAYPKNSNLSAPKVSKGLAARWKAMSDMEKSRYITQAKSASEEYNLALARMDPKVSYCNGRRFSYSTLFDTSNGMQP